MWTLYYTEGTGLQELDHAEQFAAIYKSVLAAATIYKRGGYLTVSDGTGSVLYEIRDGQPVMLRMSEYLKAQITEQEQQKQARAQKEAADLSEYQAWLQFSRFQQQYAAEQATPTHGLPPFIRDRVYRARLTVDNTTYTVYRRSAAGAPRIYLDNDPNALIREEQVPYRDVEHWQVGQKLVTHIDDRGRKGYPEPTETLTGEALTVTHTKDGHTTEQTVGVRLVHGKDAKDTRNYDPKKTPSLLADHRCPVCGATFPHPNWEPGSHYQQTTGRGKCEVEGYCPNCGELVASRAINRGELDNWMAAHPNTLGPRDCTLQPIKSDSSQMFHDYTD